MKVLLLGKTGLLGSEFLKVLKQENVDLLAPGRDELDLLDFEAVQDFLSTNKPNQIIHCGAYTAVDQAEREMKMCEKINVHALDNLLKSQIPIIHFSTDYVFDHHPHGTEIPEKTQRNPLNFYGKTKAQAEELLENSGVNYWNIRTSWIFGPGKKNFVSTILNLAETHNELQIIHDQIGRPTYALDLAKFVVENFVKNTPSSGHYHLQNTGDPVSWAEFAEYFLDKTNWNGEIKKINAADWDAPAKRPQNSVLKNTKIDKNMRDWREAGDDFLVIYHTSKQNILWD